MRDDRQTELESLGLPPIEAQAYLALLRNGGTLGASALAAAVGITRTNVYPILSSLADKGIVESEAGYGSRFTAVRPKEALPRLIAREKREIFERERRAASVVDQLESLVESNPGNNDADAELIQVLRDPRVCTERFERLQLEAKRDVDAFIKAPILNPRYSNPAQEKAMQRGVHFRGLYERAIVDSPEIHPYLAKWIAAGEEARVHDGKLPHKLALFDRQNILIPLIPPGGGPGKILFIRHPQLATSLGLLFDFLWERAEPMTGAKQKKTARVRATSSRQTSKKSTERMLVPPTTVDQKMNGRNRAV